MGRQWISLLIFGFVVCAVVLGWDIFLSLSGFKSDFTYAVNQINTNMYEKISGHLRQSPKINEYAQEAATIRSVNEFFPTVAR